MSDETQLAHGEQFCVVKSSATTGKVYARYDELPETLITKAYGDGYNAGYQECYDKEVLPLTAAESRGREAGLREAAEIAKLTSFDYPGKMLSQVSLREWIAGKILSLISK